GGAPVDCSSAVVRSAVLQPFDPLFPGEHYTALVAPPGTPSTIVDSAGNAVPNAFASFRGSLVEDETSIAAKYGWQQVIQPLPPGGSYVTEHLKGATASFTFRGAAATWYTVMGPSQGIAQVFIDGTLMQTVDQYSPATHY